MTARAPSPAARALANALAVAMKDMPYPSTDRAAYDARVSQLRDMIEAKKGRVQDNWNGARIRVHGISTSSTMGLAGACHNYITQVTLKSATASMAGAA